MEEKEKIHSIEEYVNIQRFKEKNYNESKRDKLRQYIVETVEKYGFWVISTHHDDSIEVDLHRLPTEFEQRGYLHRHDYYEMVYIYRGRNVNLFQNSRIEMKQGDILLLNPNALHCPYTLDDQDCMFNIMIPEPIMEKSMLALLSDNHLFSNFIIDYMYQVNKASDYLYFPYDPESKIAIIMETIIMEYINKNVCFQKVIESMLIYLFAELTRMYYKNNANTINGEQKNRTVADIIAYMNQHSSTVTLDSVAEKFGYSPSYVSRMIKKHTNKNYVEIIKEFKLNKAKQYLESNDLPISEIISLVGFNDASYFYKLFKSKFLLSPAEYRKQYKGENATKNS
ncbi:MAG: hypothetical protein DBX37_02330 [Massilioclostridium sp.]|nr:MAG: hypothetical protein DBX37_02330 [Massilioclostridium sp.]